MYRASRILVVAVVAVMLTGAPARATHGGIHPTVRKERVYFTCGALKIRNAEAATPGWGTTPPSQSLQQGGGCLMAEGSVVDSAVFEGDFVGNLNNLTVEAYSVPTAPGSVPQFAPLAVTLRVGDITVFANRPVSVTPAPGPVPGSEQLRFTVVGLNLLTENGDGVQSRRYRLTFRRSLNTNVAIWGASDAPGGVTFNPATIEAATITAG